MKNLSDHQEPSISQFQLDDTEKGSIRHFWLRLITDVLGNAISIPVMVARGSMDGPILGLTAAVHGNELNGVSVIQRLFREIDVATLKGTVVGVPIVNIPSFQRRKRRFIDGVDLNHIMPGLEHGNVSQVYAYRFVNRIVHQFDYLLDLHTASAGRINSHYVRADMENPITAQLALLQSAEIIVHNPPSDGTLRGAAEELNIPAITLELGNPHTFQKELIRSGVVGIHNVLAHLNMVPINIEKPQEQTIICAKSYWIYTQEGGLLRVHVDLTERINQGALIATVRDVFGNLLNEYHAPEDGIVIGKSVNPVNKTGGRILHFGIEKSQKSLY